MKTGKQTITLDSLPDDCFGKVDLTYEMLASDSYRLLFEPSNKKSDDCSDTYTMATYAGVFEPINLKQTHNMIV